MPAFVTAFAHRPLAPRGGFTLLETMLAMTIFAIASTSIYMTMRTAMRAYEIGMQSGELMQIGRFATDIVARDLRNVFYQTETSYNIQYNQRLQQIELLKYQAEQDLVDPRQLEEKIEEFNLAGVGIDLAFRGSGPPSDLGEEAYSEISFVRYQPYSGVRPAPPFCLARVDYRVADGALLRSEDDIVRPDLNLASEATTTTRPAPETLVRGVKSFLLRFGFYWDGRWVEAPDWDSSAKRHRTDVFDLRPITDLFLEESFARVIAAYESRQDQDNLPSYVYMKLTIEDPARPGQTRVFERTVDLPAAYESHVPIGDELKAKDEDDEEFTMFRGELLEPQTNWMLRADRFALDAQNERGRVERSGFWKWN
ncbi:MAG: hypothetical protein BWZ10_01306 [candidate division BRC1 bacterium ADurb.BinA364]|nr:MAG: hypothetical protein BWZ10_01306 [candidate division BRC1 bacterium ADurb.BinA364]